MAKARQPAETKRRIPRQARAAETVAAILEAAAQILEAGGLAALTTNAVAERAGVSIGTLYQYFADKSALVTALAQREMEVVLVQVARALQGEADPAPEARIRAMVRVIVNAFRGRLRARRAVIQAVMAQGAARDFMAPVAAFIAAEGARVGQAPHPAFARLSREQVFVLSRAMMGAIRSAVMEEQPFFTARSFEDELVRLLMAYLESVTRSAAAAR
ncbi:MAG: TetR/AcrR family transcriptional regulator [Pseudomonadota bacterium]